MTLFHRSREGHHHVLLWCLRFRHWSYNYASLTITLRTGSGDEQVQRAGRDAIIAAPLAEEEVGKWRKYELVLMQTACSTVLQEARQLHP